MFLSWALVAFTIEFDNTCELQMAHRTTTGRASAADGVWLASMVMYFNCMRFVDRHGIRFRELTQRARTPTNLDGMRRWGYVSLDGDLVRATRRGEAARSVWAEHMPYIEDRWRDRFGAEAVKRLRAALEQIVAALDVELPDCLPILGPGLVNGRVITAPASGAAGAGAPLPALLSKTLLAFALAFERRSPVSLAIHANVLRVLDERPVPVRELPKRAGVSRESIAVALGFLERRGLATVGREDGGRFRAVGLTAAGRGAKASAAQCANAVDRAFVERFGEPAIARVRGALEPIAGDGSADSSPLFAGLQPHAKNWRSGVAAPQTLPHFPMVLHRGGYPDGS